MKSGPIQNLGRRPKDPHGLSLGRKSDENDIEVGAAVRRLRIQRSVSQAKLAAALGVTYQQIQKYESGDTRIAVSMLLRIAERLDAPILSLLPHSGASRAALLEEIENTPGARELFTLFKALKEDQQHLVLGLLRSMR